MEQLQHQDTYNPVELIQKYIQDTARADNVVISEGIVEHPYFKVKDLFASILLLVKHCDSDFKARIQNNSLERSYGRLVLWYDAHQLLLGTGKSDVPSDLAEEITRYLKSIGLGLVDRLLLLLSKAPVKLEIDSLDRHVLDLSSWLQKVGHLGDDDDSDTASNFDYDSYADIAEDLRTDTACLIGVNTLLSTALNAPDIDTAWDTIVGHWEPHQPYCDRISNRFPDGIESLVARLGKANYERYIRCIQKREEGHDDQNDDRANTIVASNFHDSGLGSSIPGKSTYAETVMSYGGHGNEQTVRVPPLSAEARKGKPFTCIACSRTVTISNNSLWKRHLYEDLCPWLCLDPTCSSGSCVFSRRDDWVAHLASEHHMEPAWEALQCPLCRNHIGSGKASVTRHLGGHLEEIALGSLPVQIDLENNSEDGSLPSTPIAGSIRFKMSSVVLPINLNNTVSAEITDLLPSLSRSTLPAYSLQQDRPRSPGSGKYKCPYCEKECTRLIDLEGHIRTHSQENPYVCNTCHVGFRRVNDLRRHSKLHTGGLHVCQTCGRKFARGDALARHNKGPGGCVSRGTSMYEDDADNILSSAQVSEIHQQGEGHRDTPETPHSSANTGGSPILDIRSPTSKQSSLIPSSSSTLAEPPSSIPDTAIGTPYHQHVTYTFPHANTRSASEIPLQVKQYDPYRSTPRTSLGRMPSSQRGQRANPLARDQHLRERIARDENVDIQGRFLDFVATQSTRRKHIDDQDVTESQGTQDMRSAAPEMKRKCDHNENNPRGPCRFCFLLDKECTSHVPAPPASGAPFNPLSDK